MFLVILFLGLLLMGVSSLVYVLLYGMDVERFALTLVLLWGMFLVTVAIVRLGWLAI